MARFSAAWRTTGAGSTTLPIAGLMSVAGCRPRLVQVSVFNSTATACAVALRRVTAAGTSGATQSVVYESDSAQTALATPKDTWTVAPTFVAGNIEAASLGAAIGSGVIWTFGGGGGSSGLVIPNTTGDGIVLSVLTGTGQICDVKFGWDE
jgi:hypothetical protein